MIKLNEVHQLRKDKISTIENEIANLYKLVEAKKKEWTEAQGLFNDVDYYKASAKNMNQLKRFEWVQGETNYWSSGKSHKADKWTYDGVKSRFTVNIKHRDELKVWKYEVHTDVERLKHGSAYWHVNSHSKELGRAYFKDVEGYDEVFKYKTKDEAMKKIKELQQQLEKTFAKEISFDKHAYKQACKNYDNVVRINTRWDNRQALRDMLRFYTDVIIISDSGDHFELTGNNIKETITEINEKYKLKLEVVAG